MYEILANPNIGPGNLGIGGNREHSLSCAPTERGQGSMETAIPGKDSDSNVFLNVTGQCGLQELRRSLGKFVFVS